MPDKIPVTDAEAAGIKTILSVFVGKTKSFWFGFIPAFLVFVDFMFQQLDSPQAVPFANSIALVMQVFGFDGTGEDINAWLRGIAPIYVAITIMWQRRGINQPYTMTPGKVEKVTAIITDGRAAYDKGQALGKMFKK